MIIVRPTTSATVNRFVSTQESPSVRFEQRRQVAGMVRVPAVIGIIMAVRIGNGSSGFRCTTAPMDMKTKHLPYTAHLCAQADDFDAQEHAVSRLKKLRRANNVGYSALPRFTALASAVRRQGIYVVFRPLR
jgi:hypothetical protein